DDSPRVRLEAVVSLSYFADPRAMEIAARAVDSSMDRYLDEALKNTAKALKPVWVPALNEGKITFDGNFKRMEFALNAVGSKDVVKPFLKLVRDQKLSGAYLESAISMIASHGEADDIAALYAAPVPASVEGKLAATLVKAAQDRKIVPKVDAAR